MAIDRSGQLELRAASIQETGALIAMEQATTPRAWTERQLRDSINAGNRCLVAAVSGEVVGYVLLLDNGAALEILNLVVFARWQRRGLGLQLLDRISAIAEDDGRIAIWLEVRADNSAALALYRRFGFEETSRRTGYYAPVGEQAESVDAILLSWARSAL